VKIGLRWLQLPASLVLNTHTVFGGESGFLDRGADKGLNPVSGPPANLDIPQVNRQALVKPQRLAGPIYSLFNVLLQVQTFLLNFLYRTGAFDEQEKIATTLASSLNSPI